MDKEILKKALPLESLTTPKGRVQIERDNLKPFMDSIVTIPQNAIIKFSFIILHTITPFYYKKIISYK